MPEKVNDGAAKPVLGGETDSIPSAGIPDGPGNESSSGSSHANELIDEDKLLASETEDELQIIDPALNQWCNNQPSVAIPGSNQLPMIDLHPPEQLLADPAPPLGSEAEGPSPKEM